MPGVPSPTKSGLNMGIARIGRGAGQVPAKKFGAKNIKVYAANLSFAYNLQFLDLLLQVSWVVLQLPIRLTKNAFSCCWKPFIRD